MPDYSEAQNPQNAVSGKNPLVTRHYKKKNWQIRGRKKSRRSGASKPIMAVDVEGLLIRKKR